MHSIKQEYLHEMGFDCEREGTYMRHIYKKAAFISAGLVMCLAMEPMQASAVQAASVLQTAGVASILESSLSIEEYMAAAEEAKGALWGYTNLGIANVESGNLNVRAVPSTDGKLVGKMPKNAACEILEDADGWAHIKSG